MKRPADAFRALPHVSTWETEGRRYWRFRKGGRSVMLRVDPYTDPAGFMAAYQAAMAGRPDDESTHHKSAPQEGKV